MTEKELAAMEVSVREMAEILLLSPRRLQQLVAEGWIKRAVRGRYNLASTVGDYVDYLRHGSGRPDAAAPAPHD